MRTNDRRYDLPLLALLCALSTCGCGQSDAEEMAKREISKLLKDPHSAKFEFEDVRDIDGDAVKSTVSATSQGDLNARWFARETEGSRMEFQSIQVWVNGNNFYGAYPDVEAFAVLFLDGEPLLVLRFDENLDYALFMYTDGEVVLKDSNKVR